MCSPPGDAGNAHWRLDLGERCAVRASPHQVGRMPSSRSERISEPSADYAGPRLTLLQLAAGENWQPCGTFARGRATKPCLRTDIDRAFKALINDAAECRTACACGQAASAFRCRATKRWARDARHGARTRPCKHTLAFALTLRFISIRWKSCAALSDGRNASCRQCGAFLQSRACV